MLRFLRFGLIERYIFRTAISAFVLTLVVLTAVIWITQALRELDLLTAKGQTILLFLTVTSLSLPALVTIIAPVALFIATLFSLNKFNGDSELIVMSAAGVPPPTILKPFLMLAVLVSVLVGVMTIYLMPASFNYLRDLLTKIRGDMVANIVKEGQFTTLDIGVTFHFRERKGDTLYGVFMQDRRDKDKPTIYIAERGQTVDNNGASYLVLEKGSIQRQQAGSRDASIVVFDRYAIDLSQLGSDSADIVYKPRERSTADLIFPDKNETYFQIQAGRFRAELHDRLAAPLYPLAFMFISFAALGAAQTTRQGRGLAIGLAVLAVVGVRIAGFVISTQMVRSATVVPLAYLVPALTGAFCFYLTLANKDLTRPFANLSLPALLPKPPKLAFWRR